MYVNIQFILAMWHKIMFWKQNPAIKIRVVDPSEYNVSKCE